MDPVLKEHIRQRMLDLSARILEEFDQNTQEYNRRLAELRTQLEAKKGCEHCSGTNPSPSREQRSARRSTSDVTSETPSSPSPTSLPRSRGTTVGAEQRSTTLPRAPATRSATSPSSSSRSSIPAATPPKGYAIKQAVPVKRVGRNFEFVGEPSVLVPNLPKSVPTNMSVDDYDWSNNAKRPCPMCDRNFPAAFYYDHVEQCTGAGPSTS